MWTPGEKGVDEPAAEPSTAAAGPPPGDDLRMVPLHDDAEGGEPRHGSPGSSTTEFFAMPAPKRPDPPPAGGEPLRRDDPGAVTAAPTPTPMGPPPVGPIPVAPMSYGISGPVAGGPPPYGGMGHAAQLPPDLQQEVQRAQSYRVFAIVAGLMFMVFSVVVATVLLTVGVVIYGQQGEHSLVAAPPPPAPPPKPAHTVDTGVAAPPDPTPGQPKAPTPRPTPRPNPAPSTRPAQATLTLEPGSPPFTSVEIRCPNGFRERGAFVNGVAKVPDVPRELCDALFKGGSPAKSKISGGESKTCSFVGVTANCH